MLGESVAVADGQRFLERDWGDSTPPTGHCRILSPACLTVDAAHIVEQPHPTRSVRAGRASVLNRRASPTGLRVPRVSQTRRTINGMFGAAFSIQSATDRGQTSRDDMVPSKSRAPHGWADVPGCLSVSSSRPLLQVGPGPTTIGSALFVHLWFASVPTRRRVGR